MRPALASRTMSKPTPCDPVDAAEIARRLGRSRAYVARQLTTSPGFPAPEPTELNGGRWWHWADVEAWARDSGRLG